MKAGPQPNQVKLAIENSNMKKVYIVLAFGLAMVASFLYAATSGTTLPGSTALTPQYALSNVFTLAGTETTNVPASIARPNLSVQQGKGMSFSCTYVGGALNTSNAIALGFKVSNAGTTNYTTADNYIWIYLDPDGATMVRTYTNVPASILDNVEYIQLAKITNGNAGSGQSGYITNCILSQRSL